MHHPIVLFKLTIPIYLFHHTNIKKENFSHFYMECQKCGDDARLYDVVSGEGIIKVCKSCAEYWDMPLVSKPVEVKLNEPEKISSVYRRLSKMSGIDADEHRKKFSKYYREKEDVRKEQDVSLRDLVEENYRRKQNLKEEVERGILEKPKMVENFHWIVMRARRNKKLTREQLAGEIAESHTAINMVEDGILPEDYAKLVKKLESFLGVRLFLDVPENLNSKTEISFDPISTKEVTIGDLKDWRKEEEEFQKILEEEMLRKDLMGDYELFEEEVIKNPGNVFKEERDLTDEEIDDVIYGRK